MIMLWMFFWGGMINGLMILLGVWDKLRIDFVLCMMVVFVVFYGMFIFEGLFMLVWVVNFFFYYMDWMIGYVYLGVFGWVGYISFGVLYCFVFWFWNCK